jgi:hypothetical protein
MSEATVKGIRFTYVHGVSETHFETLPFYLKSLRYFLKDNIGHAVWVKGGIVEQPAYLLFTSDVQGDVVDLFSEQLEDEGVFAVEALENPQRIFELVRKYADQERVCIGYLNFRNVALGSPRTVCDFSFDFENGVWIDGNTLVRSEESAIVVAKRKNLRLRTVEDVPIVIFKNAVVLTMTRNGRIVSEQVYSKFGVWYDTIARLSSNVPMHDN